MFSLRAVVGASSGALRQFFPSVTTRTASLRPFSHMIRNSLTRLRGEAKSGKAIAVANGSAKQVEQVRGMKTRSSVKRLCDGCKVWSKILNSGNDGMTAKSCSLVLTLHSPFIAKAVSTSSGEWTL